ncbi:SusC/RagA family TonB-linked outer membrane protein [Sphingobacterium suaedae]|uniref:SusC/RagA family TonB-linked outer membrane protein n=1 Tax=Sphingobacterium suaedae TaxID=1686402 RepID=A0ABW5KEI4_9SPHI
MRYLFYLTLCFTLLNPVFADVYAQDQIEVKGVVRDSTAGLPGVSVKVVGSSVQTVSTDGFGRFSLRTDRKADITFFSVGFKPKTIKLANETVGKNNVLELDVQLISDESAIEEVTVTGFGGTQKKTSMVSSITTVNVKDLKTASSNLTNALAGQVAGMVAFQSSGEPGLGTDNSTFYIRGLSSFGTGKMDPLILIDGVESSPTDMARLQPDDISDFSVLKDAAAAAVYGARGANGVVLINTKMGKDGTPQFNFRAEGRVSSNTKNFQFADNITYMRMANEAVLTRNPTAAEPYSQNKINSTVAGADPYLFPNNNWLDQLLKPYTFNQGYNLNVTGGSPRARYYIAGTYNKDNGILNVEPINDFNSNISLSNYSMRINVDFNVTNSTTVIARMYGQFDDYTGPIGGYNERNERISGGEQTYRNALNANPVMFPAVYPASKLPFIEHPLFGSAQTRNSDLSLSSTMYVNPYAEMVKGYQQYKTSNLMPQIEVKQNLAFITPGLSGRAMGYLRRMSYYRINRNYIPFYYEAMVNPQDQSYSLRALNDGSVNSLQPVGRENLDYVQDAKDVDSRLWAEAALTYNRTFKEKHAVGGMLISYLSNYETANANNVILSLPARNLGVSGRFSYGFKDRYLAEFNFGYNGSERFDKSKRWGFFPSFGVGYRLSEEEFFEPLRSVFSNLKIRATYGIVGNDAIGNANERFFYLSNVNLNNTAYGASFGRNDGSGVYSRNGVSISRYANAGITWEESRVLNVGLDIGIANALDIVVEGFSQKRSNILQPNSGIDHASGLMAIPVSNYGKVSTQGIDVSMNYRKNFSESFRMDARGTFTYAASKIDRIDELPYPTELQYLSRKGYSINQQWGYIAERLFIDDEEVSNSPLQFSDAQLRAGDIKYRDINQDGQINTDDMVALGYPTEPEIIYGLGSTFAYKKLDFGFFFQGAARYSFFIDAQQIQPFYQSNGYQTGLLNAIASDYWSEANPNSYAMWPRLSNNRVPSNTQQSTWWLRNGGFLRLKSVDLGYTITGLRKWHIQHARVYLSATNLFVMSQFKLWDVEMRGKGMNYPLQSVYNLGVQINL